MRGKLVVMFLAGLVVGAVVAFAGWHPRALGQQGQQAQQWEYKVVHVSATPDEGPPTRVMNTVAADGWEYSGLLWTGEKFSLVTFRRPKK